MGNINDQVGRIGGRLDTELESESSQEGRGDSYFGIGNSIVNDTGQKRQMEAFLSGKKEIWLP